MTDAGKLAGHLDASAALHVRVREFVQRHAATSATAVAQTLAPSAAAEFEQLALELASFQAQTNVNYGRRVARLPQIAAVQNIVPVPADAFRYAPVFSFPVQQAEISFATSGTTGSFTGRHYLRTSETYRELLLAGAAAVFPWDAQRRPCVIALAPFGGDTPSSLGFMLQCFMQHFDARSLTDRSDAEGFAVNEVGRWLISSQGIDINSLGAVHEQCVRSDTPIWLLATSFALVQLFDAFALQRWPLPRGSVVMQTGGFKGRTRELSPTQILDAVVRHFEPSVVINEYGMTELASQLYERIELRGSTSAQASGYFQLPPWLRVLARDPVTLQALPAGSVGLANFVDLGNVDSAVSVLTQDLIQSTPNGVRLVGRNPGSPLRGCSLAIEEILRHAT